MDNPVLAVGSVLIVAILIVAFAIDRQPAYREPVIPPPDIPPVVTAQATSTGIPRSAYERPTPPIAVRRPTNPIAGKLMKACREQFGDYGEDQVNNCFIKGAMNHLRQVQASKQAAAEREAF